MKLIGMDFQCDQCHKKSSNRILDRFIERLGEENKFLQGKSDAADIRIKTLEGELDNEKRLGKEIERTQGEMRGFLKLEQVKGLICKLKSLETELEELYSVREEVVRDMSKKK